MELESTAETVTEDKELLVKLPKRLRECPNFGLPEYMPFSQVVSDRLLSESILLSDLIDVVNGNISPVEEQEGPLAVQHGASATGRSRGEDEEGCPGVPDVSAADMFVVQSMLSFPSAVGLYVQDRAVRYALKEACTPPTMKGRELALEGRRSRSHAGAAQSTEENGVDVYSPSHPPPPGGASCSNTDQEMGLGFAPLGLSFVKESTGPGDAHNGEGSREPRRRQREQGEGTLWLQDPYDPFMCEFENIDKTMTMAPGARPSSSIVEVNLSSPSFNSSSRYDSALVGARRPQAGASSWADVNRPWTGPERAPAERVLMVGAAGAQRSRPAKRCWADTLEGLIKKDARKRVRENGEGKNRQRELADLVLNFAPSTSFFSVAPPAAAAAAPAASSNAGGATTGSAEGRRPTNDPVAAGAATTATNWMDTQDEHAWYKPDVEWGVRSEDNAAPSAHPSHSKLLQPLRHL
eukprot:GHVU01018464.1.p1 GENE.GHVU01018464.1~~GHVU01018464.1.p1  ORF type:complete len:466 (+),score=65.54 GHVU01018464.1:43-1440(+)